MLHREALSYRADPKSHHTRPQEPATGGIPQQHPDDIGREVKVEMSENVNAGRIEAERKHLRARVAPAHRVSAGRSCGRTQADALGPSRVQVG